jgi:hypothetical protein
MLINSCDRNASFSGSIIKIGHGRFNRLVVLFYYGRSRFHPAQKSWVKKPQNLSTFLAEHSYDWPFTGTGERGYFTLDLGVLGMVALPCHTFGTAVYRHMKKRPSHTLLVNGRFPTIIKQITVDSQNTWLINTLLRPVPPKMENKIDHSDF